MPIKSLLKPEIKKWFDKSAESELYASHLYQYIGNQLQRIGMFGGQKYFLNESKEELTHYQKLADFVNDMGDVLSVPAIEAIKDKISNIGDALEVAYDTETALMDQYKKFYKSAEDSGDCVTSTFLIEFLQIQRKSVGELGDLISRYELNKNDLFEFDENIGELVNG